MSLDAVIQKTLGKFQLDVAFQMHGGILGLLGASGCGKSKTLQCITGIESPDAGHISLDGRVFFDSSRHINMAVRERRVGYLFQHYALFPNMTVAENIACGIRQSVAKQERKEKIYTMMERMRLTGMEKQKPSQLSGGQQQRVALARILVNEPDILLLDEPLSALDSYLKEQVMAELKELLRQFQKDSIVVTHSRDEAYQLCDAIAVLDNGQLEVIGKTADVFAQPQTKAAAVLTGCKNIVAAQKTGTCEVFVPDWGISLTTEQPVGDTICAVGVRGHAFHQQVTANVYPIRVMEEIEQPFEWIVKFRYENQRAASPAVWWRFAKTDRPPQLEAPLGVRPQDILLLYK